MRATGCIEPKGLAERNLPPPPLAVAPAGVEVRRESCEAERYVPRVVVESRVGGKRSREQMTTS